MFDKLVELKAKLANLKSDRNAYQNTANYAQVHILALTEKINELESEIRAVTPMDVPKPAPAQDNEMQKLKSEIDELKTMLKEAKNALR